MSDNRPESRLDRLERRVAQLEEMVARLTGSDKPQSVIRRKRTKEAS